MAGIATDVWEFRATSGDAANGGGFDTASGGTDYSNQDAAQASWTNLSSSGTTVTDDDAGGLFTSAMVGNYMQGDDNKFVRVTAFIDSNNVTVDATLSPAWSGTSAKLGGALDVMTDQFFDGAGDLSKVVAGATIYIKNDGTMTMTGNLDLALPGTATAYVKFIGYNTTRGDNPTGTDRPLIAFGAYRWLLSNFHSIENLRLTGTETRVVRGASGTWLRNVHANNTSGTSTRYAFEPNNLACVFIGCEGQSVNGRAAFGSSLGGKFIDCYFHDSEEGIECSSASEVFVTGCVFDACTRGIETTGSGQAWMVANNTFYNCSSFGIDGHSGTRAWVIVNNIFKDCDTGVSFDDNPEGLYMDYNVWDNTTNDVLNVSKGSNAVTGDPSMNDPASGDFTLSSGSNAIDAGRDATNAGVAV